MSKPEVVVKKRTDGYWHIYIEIGGMAPFKQHNISYYVPAMAIRDAKFIAAKLCIKWRVES